MSYSEKSEPPEANLGAPPGLARFIVHPRLPKLRAGHNLRLRPMFSGEPVTQVILLVKVINTHTHDYSLLMLLAGRENLYKTVACRRKVFAVV